MNLFRKRSKYISFSSFLIFTVFFLLTFEWNQGSKSVVDAHPTGFCGDCQSFANALKPCGGTFGPPDIEVSGTYELDRRYQKCLCTDAVRAILWTCARCEFLAGHNSTAPPPVAYRTKCFSWGTTTQEWEAPYTGEVAPGSITAGTGNNGGGGGRGSGGGSGGGKDPSTPSDGSGNGGSPSQSSGSGSTPTLNPDGITAPEGDSTQSSGPSITAIGVSMGLVGFAVTAGIVSMVMIRRRGRSKPLELDAPPISSYTMLRDDWEKPNGSGNNNSNASLNPNNPGHGRAVSPVPGHHMGAHPQPSMLMPAHMNGRQTPFEARPYPGNNYGAQSTIGYDDYDPNYGHDRYNQGPYYGHQGPVPTGRPHYGNNGGGSVVNGQYM